MPMADRLTLDIDVHRIGKPVAGVMAGRDFEYAVGGVMIATQDAQRRRAFGDAKRLGNVRAGCDRLNILRHLDEVNLRKPFDLLENSIFAGADFCRNIAQAFVNISNSVRKRFGRVSARAQALKPAPSSARDKAKLLGNIAWQRAFSQGIEHRAGIAGILKNFGDVGQWLMQRAAACSGWLNARARSAPARNKALGLQRTQSLSHGKSRHGISLAQVAFGRKGIGFVRPAEDFLAQFVGQFLVTRLGGQIFSPRSATGAA
jgi:hypothetical protein